MSKHTSGPWVYAGTDGYSRRVILKDDGNPFGTVENTVARLSETGVCEIEKSGGAGTEADANAILFAAAPELLNALDDAQREITRLQGGFAGKLQERIAAILSKAEGK